MQLRDERLAWARGKLLEQRRTALRYFSSKLRVMRKADDSPVTVADRLIEERLRRELGRAFPSEAIVGEEFGRPANPGSTYWTVDPIDGTRAFSRGLPSWGMLIGFVERGRPVMGACLYPALGIFLGVGRGTPAFESDGKTHRAFGRVSAPSALPNISLFHGGSSWWLGSRYAKGFIGLTQKVYLERAYGDCFGYLYLLRGQCDAMVEYGVKVYDVAPFAAMAASTGRVMIDCHGEPCFTGPECIVAHPTLAMRIAQQLRSYQTRPRSALPCRS